MSPEFEERVDSVLEDILSREPSERRAFLHETCGEDAELLREVSSLLHFHERAGSFLETPSPLARGFQKAEGWNEPTFVEGELVSGRFEIVRLLDRGGMGEVYEARDRDLKERVALKTIRPELALEKKSIEHFHEEVRLARRITHRNVCRIHDIFRASNEGTPDVLFLSMEYLEGESLAKRLRRDDRVAWMEALPLLIQIAGALEAAWMEKVLHRDLKSENVMLVEDGGRLRAIVTDFGLASLADNVDASPVHDMGALSARASSRAAWGTPAYMSPEQLRGESMDHRSDLFSLGVIAYEMITGEQPYPLQNGAPLLERFRVQPPAPREIESTIPRALETLIQQCLSVDPNHRPDGAARVVERIEAIPTTKGLARRAVLITGLSVVGGAMIARKAGPQVLEYIEKWVSAPRILALEDYVDSPDALEALRVGISRVRDGANLEAVLFFERAIADDSASVLARVELVETLLDVGEERRARAILGGIEEIASAKPTDQTERSLMRSVRARIDEDYQTATTELRTLLHRYSDDLHLSLRYARHLEESGKFVEALPLYQAISADSFAATLGVGRALAYSGTPTQVIGRHWLQMPSRRQPVSLEAQGMLYSILGVMYGEMGEYENAIHQLTLSLEYRVKAGDRRGEAASLTNLASVYRRMGRIREVNSLLERALKISREMGDRSYEAYTLSKSAVDRLASGQPTVALDLCRQALAIEWPRQDHSQLAARLNTISYAQTLIGLYEDAQITLAEAIKHIESSGQKDQLAKNLMVQGWIAVARGDFNDSDRLLSRAAELYLKNDFAWGLPPTNLIQALSHRLRGAYVAADALLQEASNSLLQQSNGLELAENEVHQAALLVAQGAFEVAAQVLLRAEQRLRGARYYRTGPEILLVKGDLLLAREKRAEARGSFARAAEASADSGFRDLEIEAKIRQAQVAEPQDFLGAMSLLDEAWKSARKLRLRPLVSIAELAMADLHFKLADLPAAVDAATNAIDLAEPMSLKPVLFRGYIVLGDALSGLGKSEASAAAYMNGRKIYQWLLENVVADHRDAFQARHRVPEWTAV